MNVGSEERRSSPERRLLGLILPLPGEHHDLPARAVLFHDTMCLPSSSNASRRGFGGGKGRRGWISDGA